MESTWLVCGYELVCVVPLACRCVAVRQLASLLVVLLAWCLVLLLCPLSFDL
jgi:hypothetical protein